jgi:hypothetical protein
MQLVSINVGSKELPNTLARLLASQEGMVAAMSAQGDDALVLVDILDQVSRLRTIAAPHLTPTQAFETPNTDLDLRRKCIHISGEFVARRRFCHVLAYSWTIFRRRMISSSLTNRLEMSGRVATMGNLCV